MRSGTVLCCAVLCLRRWEPCSDVLQYTHTVGSMIPVHRELLEAGLRALVLSGQGQVHGCAWFLLSDNQAGDWPLHRSATQQVLVAHVLLCCSFLPSTPTTTVN